MPHTSKNIPASMFNWPHCHLSIINFHAPGGFRTILFCHAGSKNSIFHFEEVNIKCFPIVGQPFVQLLGTQLWMYMSILSMDLMITRRLDPTFMLTSRFVPLALSPWASFALWHPNNHLRQYMVLFNKLTKLRRCVLPGTRRKNTLWKSKSERCWS